ncbi:hypothetical protein ATKI12_8169 [Kitasatospora sp. Ki12]
MNPDDNDLGQRWTRRLLAVLAADPADQLAWAREHRVRTAALTDDIELVLQLAEAMAERGTLAPEVLEDVRTIHRLFGGTATGRWADALAAEARWDGMRASARRVLTAREGDWRLPLPRRVSPGHVYD